MYSVKTKIMASQKYRSSDRPRTQSWLCGEVAWAKNAGCELNIFASDDTPFFDWVGSDDYSELVNYAREKGS